MWHPQHGDIAGLKLAEWIERVRSTVSPSRSIILATDERTGSEWLCHLLAKTNKLGIPSEYVNTAWMRRFIQDYPDSVLEQIRIAHQVGTTSNGIFSIKIHPWHFDRISKELALEDCCPNPVFVRLTREDILLQAISLWKARISNSYHSFVPLESKPQYKADAIEQIMFQLMHNNRRWDTYFMRNDIRPLQISYEQLQKSPLDCIEKIADLVQTSIDTKNLLESPIMAMQRDEETLAWRHKFCSEKKDLNRLDLPASPDLQDTLVMCHSEIEQLRQRLIQLESERDLAQYKTKQLCQQIEAQESEIQDYRDSIEQMTSSINRKMTAPYRAIERRIKYAGRVFAKILQYRRDHGTRALVGAIKRRFITHFNISSSV